MTTTTEEGVERAAIEQVVATIQRTQQNELVEEFLELFRPDATFVTARGRRMLDREEIAAVTRTALPGSMQRSKATYEIQHVVFVRPDVAVVAVRQRTVTLDGRPVEGRPEGRPTYVMAKDATGAWKLVAAQNTLVATA